MNALIPDQAARGHQPKLREMAAPATSRAEYLTVEEVAGMIRMSAAWVRAHANGNRKPVIPSVKVGKFRRFRHQSVLDFMRNLEQQMGPEERHG